MSVSSLSKKSISKKSEVFDDGGFANPIVDSNTAGGDDALGGGHNLEAEKRKNSEISIKSNQSRKADQVKKSESRRSNKKSLSSKRSEQSKVLKGSTGNSQKDDKKASRVSGIPIWDLCINSAKRLESSTEGRFKLRPSLIIPVKKEEISNASLETTLLFVGAKSSGKTSLILRFLERDEVPKPTTALDYTFGRRSRDANINKDIVHVWELGGGMALSNLLEVPVHANCIKTLSVLVVVDLSKPESIWATLESLIMVIQCRVKDVLADLAKKDPGAAAMLKEAKLAQYGNNHPDLKNLDIIPIPMVIMGTKYDEFENRDSGHRKLICRTLRYVAHHYGAYLCFYSAKNEALVARGRNLMNNLAFKSEINTSTVTDPARPLFVVPGMDDITQIGQVSDGSSRPLLSQWKQQFLTNFPQEKEATKPDDPSVDPKFNEPTVDSARKAKDEELQQFIKQQERLARDEARQRRIKGVS